MCRSTFLHSLSSPGLLHASAAAAHASVPTKIFILKLIGANSDSTPWYGPKYSILLLDSYKINWKRLYLIEYRTLSIYQVVNSNSRSLNPNKEHSLGGRSLRSILLIWYTLDRRHDKHYQDRKDSSLPQYIQQPKTTAQENITKWSLYAVGRDRNSSRGLWFNLIRNSKFTKRIYAKGR